MAPVASGGRCRAHPTIGGSMATQDVTGVGWPTPAHVVPTPAALLEVARNSDNLEPDLFLYAHGSVAAYTTGDWGSHYVVMPCLGCAATGHISGATWLVVPVVPGFPLGTCPICMGTGWQPTLGTCKLALANARGKHKWWQRDAEQYAHDYAELQLAAEDGNVAELVISEQGVVNRYTAKDIPMLKEKIEKLGHRSLRNAALCGFDVKQIEEFTTMLKRLRSHMKQAHRPAPAAPAPAPAPKHDPRKVCNGYEQVKGKRKRCHRAPQEWDERGHGWCRRHAHKRGLHKPEEGVA